MNKKRIIIGTVAVLLLSTLFHGVYDIFPNWFTALFFPVNESIWEHNKMILLAFFVWALIEKIFFKEDKSVFFQDLLQMIFCILILDLTFTPFYLYVLNTNDNIVITIIWYAVSILLSFLVGEKYLISSKNQAVEKNSIIGFVMVAVIFAILTFNPFKTPIFYDYQSNIYGIK